VDLFESAVTMTVMHKRLPILIFAIQKQLFEFFFLRCRNDKEIEKLSGSCHGRIHDLLGLVLLLETRHFGRSRFWYVMMDNNFMAMDFHTEQKLFMSKTKSPVRGRHPARRAQQSDRFLGCTQRFLSISNTYFNSALRPIVERELLAS
jgi:hypothetical protein